MKFLSKIIALFAMALTMGITAHASDKLLLASGDSKTGSTYGIIVDQLLERCGATGVEAHVTTGGGTTNRKMLLANEVEMAVLPTDLLEITRRRDPSSVKDIRTLIPLHTEEVHFVARADVKKEGGFLGFNQNSVSFNDLSALAGRNVGAVGGSVDTASVISAASGLNYKVVRFNTAGELTTALKKGEIDSGVIVVGAPSTAVSDLGNAFRLLPIPDALIAKLTEKGLYQAAKVTYENMGAVGLNTVAARAVIATRTYEDPATISKLKAFRACFYQNQLSIRDARRTHPKWRSMDVNLKDGWQWYNLQ